MIYLIDDNQYNQRLNNYNITFVEDGVFEGYLTSIEKLEQGKSFSDITHLDFLKSADCILLHSNTEDYDEDKGFLSGQITNVKKIKEVISQEGEKIPLVLFSNSMGDAVYVFDDNPNYISAIMKNLFYKHLFDFLNHYKNTEKVDLRILAWGKNFISKEVSKLAFDILRTVELKNNSEVLTLSDIASVLKSFTSFIELCLPNDEIKEILNDVEDSPLKIQDFKKKINKIIESYAKFGENIYTWK